MTRPNGAQLAARETVTVLDDLIQMLTNERKVLAKVTNHDEREASESRVLALLVRSAKELDICNQLQDVQVHSHTDEVTSRFDQALWSRLESERRVDGVLGDARVREICAEHQAYLTPVSA